MKKMLICMINWYQNHLSSWLANRQINCKYYPRCSDYAIEALEEYGTLKGSFLSLKRILKCNPFSKGGYDPLKK